MTFGLTVHKLVCCHTQVQNQNFLGDAAWSQELDAAVLMGLFQLGISCHSTILSYTLEKVIFLFFGITVSTLRITFCFSEQTWLTTLSSAAMAGPIYNQQH